MTIYTRKTLKYMGVKSDKTPYEMIHELALPKLIEALKDVNMAVGALTFKNTPDKKELGDIAKYTIDAIDALHMVEFLGKQGLRKG